MRLGDRLKRLLAAVKRRGALSLFALVLPVCAQAGDKLVNVQGKLTDLQGVALTGSPGVTFRLYASSTAAVSARVWEETLTVPLQSGMFNTTLGKSASLDGLAFNKSYYLGIQVAGDAQEMSPRQALGASPYALGSLGDFNVGRSLSVANGTFTLKNSSNVVVDVQSNKHAFLKLTPGAEGGLPWGMFAAADSNRLGFYSYGSAREVLSLFHSGQVGVGLVPSYGFDGLWSLSNVARFRSSFAGDANFVLEASTGQRPVIGLWQNGTRRATIAVDNAGERVSISNGAVDILNVGVGGAVNGNVGIGSTAPTEALTVQNGRVRIMGPIADGLASTEEEKNRATLRVQGTVDYSSGRMIILQAPWPAAWMVDRHFMVGMDADGVNRFHIRGDGAYLTSSSRMLKTNIEAIPDALGKLSRVSGVSYNWKGEKSGKKTMGFIAEDLSEVFPELVEDGRFVNYDGMIPVLVQCIKDLQAKVESLEKKIVRP